MVWLKNISHHFLWMGVCINGWIDIWCWMLRVDSTLLLTRFQCVNEMVYAFPVATCNALHFEIYRYRDIYFVWQVRLSDGNRYCHHPLCCRCGLYYIVHCSRIRQFVFVRMFSRNFYPFSVKLSSFFDIAHIVQSEMMRFRKHMKHHH